MLTGIKSWLWLTVTAILLAGCVSVSGSGFAPVTQIAPDKALIYVYREPGLRGAAITPDVNIGDEFRFPLTIGGYYPYFATPGKLTVSATALGTRSVTFDARPGQTYYVKGGTVPMGLGVPAIELVSPEQGVAEIKDCKLLTLSTAK